MKAGADRIIPSWPVYYVECRLLNARHDAGGQAPDDLVAVASCEQHNRQLFLKTGAPLFAC